MAQFIRPISDLDNTGVWTTAPIFSKINNSVGAGDGSYVTSDSAPTAAEPFTVDGGTITDPAASTGHILRVRGNKETSGGALYDIVCELRQGYVSEASQGTLIATATISATDASSPVTQAYTLSGVEADSITDYADLQFRCYAVKNGGGAGRNCEVTDVELETPDVSTTGINLKVAKGVLWKDGEAMKIAKGGVWKNADGVIKIAKGGVWKDV